MTERRSTCSIACVIAAVAVGGPWWATSAAPSDSRACLPLRDLALAKGAHVELRRDTEAPMTFGGVDALVKESHTVAVGTTSALRSFALSDDGCDIVSKVNVRLSAVLKGDVLPTQIVALSLPGGRVDFSESAWAEIRVWGRYHPVVGDSTYVLFLTPLPDDGGYALSGGMQGVYLTDPTTGKIEPADMRGRQPLADHCRGMKTEAFLQEIRSIIAKQAATQ